MADTTYEVNIRMGGEWKFESRYGEFEKDEAIEDAKRVADTPGVEAVKVIKETYDSGSNQTRESTVFSTSKLASVGEQYSGQDFSSMEVKVDDGPDLANMAVRSAPEALPPIAPAIGTRGQASARRPAAPARAAAWFSSS